MKKILRLGTRGSPLAIIQAEETRARLLAANPGFDDENTIEIVPIRTSGDWRPEHKERTFLEIGGDKGLFTKEIEEGLLDQSIDMAVHSLKDMPSRLPPGLEIAAILERADARDAFVSTKAASLDLLPQGAVIGTSSVRRQAQLLALRPDLRVVPLRGNVGTRLVKLAKGDADATILAVAGMQRLGLGGHIASIMEPAAMLPCAGQGAIGIEIRSDDSAMRKLAISVHCATTGPSVEAERAFLLALDGSCSTPIGALARLDKDKLTLDALAAKPDGSSVIRMSKSGTAKDARAIGEALGEAMKAKLPPGFFEAAA